MVPYLSPYGNPYFENPLTQNYYAAQQYQYSIQQHQLNALRQHCNYLSALLHGSASANFPGSSYSEPPRCATPGPTPTPPRTVTGSIPQDSGTDESRPRTPHQRDYRGMIKTLVPLMKTFKTQPELQPCVQSLTQILGHLQKCERTYKSLKQQRLQRAHASRRSRAGQNQNNEPGSGDESPVLVVEIEDSEAE